MLLSQKAKYFTCVIIVGEVRYIPKSFPLAYLSKKKKKSHKEYFYATKLHEQSCISLHIFMAQNKFFSLSSQLSIVYFQLKLYEKA